MIESKCIVEKNLEHNGIVGSVREPMKKGRFTLPLWIAISRSFRRLATSTIRGRKLPRQPAWDLDWWAGVVDNSRRCTQLELPAGTPDTEVRLRIVFELFGTAGDLTWVIFSVDTDPCHQNTREMTWDQSRRDKTRKLSRFDSCNQSD